MTEKTTIENCKFTGFTNSTIKTEHISNTTKYSHYIKDISHLKKLDVYRILELYEVNNPCVQHAIKKLLVPGNRNEFKTIEVDIQEAIVSLERCLEMLRENLAEAAELV